MKRVLKGRPVDKHEGHWQLRNKSQKRMRRKVGERKPKFITKTIPKVKRTNGREFFMISRKERLFFFL